MSPAKKIIGKKNHHSKVGEVLDMGYHRNGCSGRGFWTILFKGHSRAENNVAGHTFVATFFPGEDHDPEDPDIVGDDPCVAVLRLRDLDQGNANNYWRGENFEKELEELVKNYVWPFEKKNMKPADPNTGRRAAINAQKAKKAV